MLSGQLFPAQIMPLRRKPGRQLIDQGGQPGVGSPSHEHGDLELAIGVLGTDLHRAGQGLPLTAGDGDVTLRLGHATQPLSWRDYGGAGPSTAPTRASLARLARLWQTRAPTALR